MRLAEVDCPESKQPFGKNAKQFTSSKIFGKQIIYQPIQKDRYGRTIAKVYFDNGKYLSEELIKNVLGWWYSKYSKNENLGKIQSLAKKNIIIFKIIFYRTRMNINLYFCKILI